MLKKATLQTVTAILTTLTISTAVHATGVDVTLGGSSSASGGSATGGAANAQGISTSSSNSQGGAGGSAKQGQFQGQSLNSNTGGNTLANAASGNSTNVSVEGARYEAAKIPVATAYAAPLTSGADTCSGSSSGGMQGPGFGISFGSTWTDENCVRLKNAKMMDGLGFRDVAISMMCADRSVADAMKATGRECPAKSE